MNESDEIKAFGKELRRIFNEFQEKEKTILDMYAEEAGRRGLPESGTVKRTLLERPTRRHLIDPMLCALGWNLDCPDVIIEEDPRKTENGRWIYCDYSGFDTHGIPVLLVEAKKAEAKSARSPGELNFTSQDAADLISKSLRYVKAGERPPGILAEWAEWLNDLLAYVRSLSGAEPKNLRRVVITSGRWMIIFNDPATAFINDAGPTSDEVKCYMSMEEILMYHDEIYKLLARRYFIETTSPVRG